MGVSQLLLSVLLLKLRRYTYINVEPLFMISLLRTLSKFHLCTHVQKIITRHQENNQF